MEGTFLMKNKEGAVYFAYEANVAASVCSYIKFGAAFCNPSDFPQNRKGFSKKQFRQKADLIARGRLHSDSYWKITPCRRPPYWESQYFCDMNEKAIENILKRWIITCAGYSPEEADKGKVKFISGVVQYKEDLEETPHAQWLLGDPARFGMEAYVGRRRGDFSRWMTNFARVLLEEIRQKRIRDREKIEKEMHETRMRLFPPGRTR